MCSSVHSFYSAPGAELQELQSGEIVFQSGALVVMFDQTLRTQRFFQGHDEAITAMAVHPDKVVVATSQGGKKNGTVCIWNSGARPAEWSPTTERTEEEKEEDGGVINIRKRVEEIKRILIPKNIAGMGSMDFNQKGELLAMVTSVGDGELLLKMICFWILFSTNQIYLYIHCSNLTHLYLLVSWYTLFFLFCFSLTNNSTTKTGLYRYASFSSWCY